jgi:hypothetical protein
MTPLPACLPCQAHVQGRSPCLWGITDRVVGPGLVVPVHGALADDVASLAGYLGGDVVVGDEEAGSFVGSWHAWHLRQVRRALCGDTRLVQE